MKITLHNLLSSSFSQSHCLCHPLQLLIIVRVLAVEHRVEVGVVAGVRAAERNERNESSIIIM